MNSSLAYEGIDLLLLALILCLQVGLVPRQVKPVLGMVIPLDTWSELRSLDVQKVNIHGDGDHSHTGLSPIIIGIFEGLGRHEMESAMTMGRTMTVRADAFIAQLKQRFFREAAGTAPREAAGDSRGINGGCTAAQNTLCSPGAARCSALQEVSTPMYFRKGASLSTITYAELLAGDSDRLGGLWPRLGTCKYGLFAGLSPAEQALLEKRLIMYAYEHADRDFSRGCRGTFEHFGRRLKEIPSLTAMGDRDRAAALFRHYLNFTEQHGVTFSHVTSSGCLLPAGNPVEAMQKGRGGCSDYTGTLQQMFRGGGIPCETVETWHAAGEIVTPARHCALSTGSDKDGSPRDIYDPSMYLAGSAGKGDRASWSGALSWRMWINQVRISHIRRGQA